MLFWSTIGYGAALSAALGVLLALIARERRSLVLLGSRSVPVEAQWRGIHSCAPLGS